MHASRVLIISTVLLIVAVALPPPLFAYDLGTDSTDASITAFDVGEVSFAFTSPPPVPPAPVLGLLPSAQRDMRPALAADAIGGHHLEAMKIGPGTWATYTCDSAKRWSTRRGAARDLGSSPALRS